MSIIHVKAKVNKYKVPQKIYSLSGGPNQFF